MVCSCGELALTLVEPPVIRSANLRDGPGDFGSNLPVRTAVQTLVLALLNAHALATRAQEARNFKTSRTQGRGESFSSLDRHLNFRVCPCTGIRPWVSFVDFPRWTVCGLEVTVS